MLKEFTKVEEIPEENAKIYYMRIKMPMMSERDNVMRIFFETRPDGSRFISCTTVDHPKCPIRPGVVRMHSVISALISKSEEIENAYNYTELDHFDMKGYFPARLMNMIIASSVKTEFAKCYNHIRLDKKK